MCVLGRVGGGGWGGGGVGGDTRERRWGDATVGDEMLHIVLRHELGLG